MEVELLRGRTYIHCVNRHTQLDVGSGVLGSRMLDAFFGKEFIVHVTKGFRLPSTLLDYWFVDSANQGESQVAKLFPMLASKCSN